MRHSLLLAFALACRAPADDGKPSDDAVVADTAASTSTTDTDTPTVPDSDTPPIETGTAPTADADGDGYDAATAGGDDCDDADPARNPGATEVCNGLDDDCDNRIDLLDPSLDLSTAIVQYADGDGDGVGSASVTACELQAGNVLAGGDCDDANPALFPGNPEICDGDDEDCDLLLDDDDPDLDPALLTVFYVDDDLDGAGDPARPVSACIQGDLALAGDDCDDTDYSVRGPRGWYADADLDGYGGGPAIETACAPVDPTLTDDGRDCAPDDPAIHPDLVDVCGDGVDQNCDGGDCHASLSGDRDAADLEMTLYGEGPAEYAGTDMALGDLDGDGIPELVEIGGAGSGAGYATTLVHVWRGPFLPGEYDLADAPVAITGEAPISTFYAVLLGKDLTGDGVGDLALSDTAFGGYAGRVYVIPGPLQAGGAVAALATTTFDGDGLNANAGLALGTADVDGDGLTELWTSAAPGYGADGAVWCAEGPVAGGPQTLDGLGSKVQATQAQPLLVQSFAVADYDADGVDDLAFATGNNPAFDGAVLVYRHTPAGVEPLAGADFTIAGNAAQVINSAETVGDITGDGYDDLLVGAPFTHVGAGSVFLIAGPLGPLSTAVAEIQGTSAFGAQMSAVGDPDGDGHQEVLVRGFTGPPLYEKDEYLLDLEGATGVLAAADVTQLLLHDVTAEGLDPAAGGADLDGDGYDDVAIGSELLDSPAGVFNAGGVRLLFGAPE